MEGLQRLVSRRLGSKRRVCTPVQARRLISRGRAGRRARATRSRSCAANAQQQLAVGAIDVAGLARYASTAAPSFAAGGSTGASSPAECPVVLEAQAVEPFGRAVRCDTRGSRRPAFPRRSDPPPRVRATCGTSSARRSTVLALQEHGHLRLERAGRSAERLCVRDRALFLERLEQRAGVFGRHSRPEIW